jgi:hypothetical protein
MTLTAHARLTQMRDDIARWKATADAGSAAKPNRSLRSNNDSQSRKMTEDVGDLRPLRQSAPSQPAA